MRKIPGETATAGRKPLHGERLVPLSTSVLPEVKRFCDEMGGAEYTRRLLTDEYERMVGQECPTYAVASVQLPEGE